MPVTNIFITRHGETEYNRTQRIQGRGIDEPLNETGRLQARAVGKALQEADIHYLFSSSLERAIETAQIAAQVLQRPLQSYPELDEMDFGIIEGRPITNIADKIEKLHHSWKNGHTSFALEQGESPETVLKRVLSRIDHLLEEHEGSNILFVLHGRLIRILLAHWLGYGLPLMHQIEHQNGALYHLQMTQKKITPVYINKVDHLNGHEKLSD